MSIHVAGYDYSNLDFPTGKVKDNNQQVLVRLEGKYQSVADIENVVVKTLKKGGIVKVKDVADVYDTQKEVSTIQSRERRNVHRHQYPSPT